MAKVESSGVGQTARDLYCVSTAVAPARPQIPQALDGVQFWSTPRGAGSPETDPAWDDFCTLDQPEGVLFVLSTDSGEQVEMSEFQYEYLF